MVESTVVGPVDSIRETVDALYVAESRRVLATLIRLLGDFEAAEEALHDAFKAALEQWPRDGMPAPPANGVGRSKTRLCRPRCAHSGFEPAWTRPDWTGIDRPRR